MRKILQMSCCVLPLMAGTVTGAEQHDIRPSFTVSMGEPSTHYLHVVMRWQGKRGQDLDLKMPSWTPGYYKIMDHARNVVDFRAQDGEGHSLAWEKTTKNTWHLRSRDVDSVQVSYDVYAFARSVADSFLDDTLGFLSPTGLFLHPAGQLGQPVTVTIEPAKGFARVSTGLEPVPGRPNTFQASDFDELYDCPILVGNQEVLSFEVRGIPHRVSIIEPGRFDRDKLVQMLSRVVEAAVAVVGDVPYRHYDFLLLGEGMGGLEHRNSVAAFTKIPNLDDPKEYRGFLAFLAHEFFHLYNVKAIRPIALGPFDYDQENYTNLLWLSEGVTVYYEDLILNRAGFLPRDECLERFREHILDYEGKPGHRLQSATQASRDVWLYFLRSGGDAGNTTISYYDKGAALGLLLDLEIRHQTRNRRSLDDVMRTLYDVYYKKKRRGFTDEELRRVSEAVAGASLAELLEVYASTTAEIDYGRYLAYAGLEIQIAPRTLAGASLGATTREQEGRLVVAGVTRDSAAAKAGLSVDDEILAFDGVRISAKTLADELRAAARGDKVRLLVARRDRVREIEIVLDPSLEPTFKIQPLPHLDARQSETLDAWLPKTAEEAR